MLHKNVVVGDNHYLQQWEPANAAARTALVVASTDVGKVARQLDTNVWYILTDDSPMTWQVIGSGGGTVTSVTSANADATVATTTSTPVITLVQTPALRSATTTVNVSSATAPTSGQVLTATSGTAATWQTPAASSGITLDTPVTLTTQTSVTFTVPSGTKKIVVGYYGVSSNGTSAPRIRIGDSGGVETAGYVSAVMVMIANSPSQAPITDGFVAYGGPTAASVATGKVVLDLINSSTNTWSANGFSFNDVASDVTAYIIGYRGLDSEITTVTLTTAGGVDQFDAGVINCTYQS